MDVVYLDIWLCGGGQSRNKTWTKYILTKNLDFFPSLANIITDFKIWKGFGGNFEHPNIWIFEHVNRETNYSSLPVRPLNVYLITGFCNIM